MSEQNPLNQIYNAGANFEPKAVSETSPAPAKAPEPKKKRSLAGAFMPKTEEDAVKKKVEAALEGIGEEKEVEAEEIEQRDEETIIGNGQDKIGENLPDGKRIRVEGNAGNGTGCSMTGGEIRVKGNAGGWTGNSMSGGEICVEGNTENSTGSYMTGGEIHVKGDAGYGTGHGMKGGEICVEGNAGNLTGLSMFRGTLRIYGDVTSFHQSAFTPQNLGTIIWKGEKIWENRQKVEPGWTKLNVESKIAKS